MDLHEEIRSALDKCPDQETKTQYETRLEKGSLARDEDIHSHFCAYFVPYNPANKTILVGDHKKSGLWLMPGGHIDANESLLETVNREIEEELGVANFFSERPEPFNPVFNRTLCWYLWLNTSGTANSFRYAI